MPTGLAGRLRQLERARPFAPLRSGQPPNVTAIELLRTAGLEPDAAQIRICESAGQYQLWLAHRQFGKSTLAGALALETACNTPDALVLLLSRTLRQSGELFRKVKRFYNATAPLGLVRSSALSLELENGSRVVSLPGSADTVVGYSAPQLIVIDEAARVSDSLYAAIRPMLLMSRGKLIALSTPWGRRGWFFNAWTGAEDEQEREQAPLSAEQVIELLATVDIAVDPARLQRETPQTFGWARTLMAAGDNPRVDPYFLANELRTVPRMIFDSEWRCIFTETEDTVFRYDDLTAMMDDRIAPLWSEGAPLIPWAKDDVLALFSDQLVA